MKSLLTMAAILLCASSIAAQVKSIGKKRPSPDDGVFEMRCRGGSAFEFKDVRAGTLEIRFEKSPYPAANRISPGGCAWMDRAVNDAEPAIIRVDVSASDGATMRQELQRADWYWSFFVFNTNEGYFQAKRSVSIKPAGTAWNKVEASIRLQIHYNKEYGHAETRTAFGDDPNACTGFAITVTPATSAPPQMLIGIPATGLLSDAGDQYSCVYELTDVPMNYPISIDLSARDPKGPWVGGSQPQPPPKMHRKVLNRTRTVTVTRGVPHVKLDYQMIYARW